MIIDENKIKEYVNYHDFFCDYDSHDAMYARDRFEECILIFVSDTEKENFKDYAASKWSKRQDYLEDVRLPRMELPGVYREDAFKEEYENALVMKKMLDEHDAISCKTARNKRICEC